MSSVPIFKTCFMAFKSAMIFTIVFLSHFWRSTCICLSYLKLFIGSQSPSRICATPERTRVLKGQANKTRTLCAAVSKNHSVIFLNRLLWSDANIQSNARAHECLWYFWQNLDLRFSYQVWKTNSISNVQAPDGSEEIRLLRNDCGQRLSGDVCSCIRGRVCVQKQHYKGVLEFVTGGTWLHKSPPTVFLNP